MEEKLALKLHGSDNVAVLFCEGAKAGDSVTIRDKEGKVSHLKLLSDVPYGHKIAITDIQKGELVLKYGEAIGGASCEIKAGMHAHVQNVDSLRGRGDLSDAKEAR